MADVICQGMTEVEGTEAKSMSIDSIDEEWLRESSCVILGTPTYYTGACEEIEQFLQHCDKYDLAGKLGGAFATANFIYGGGEIGIQNILTRLMFWGMLIYSVLFNGTGAGVIAKDRPDGYKYKGQRTF